MKKLYIWMLGAVLGVAGATAQEQAVMIGETGYATLQDAVTAAQDNDVIVVNENVVLSGGRVDIAKNLTIKGGKDGITISRSGRYDQLMILAQAVDGSTGITLTLENLTFDGANTTKTAIESQNNASGKAGATLQLNNVVMKNFNQTAVNVAGWGVFTNFKEEDCAEGINIINSPNNNRVTFSGDVTASIWLPGSNVRCSVSDLTENSKITLRFEPAKRTNTFIVSGSQNVDNFVCGVEDYYLMAVPNGQKDPGIHVAKAVIVNETTGVSYGDLATAWNATVLDVDNVLLIKENVALKGNRLNCDGRTITLKGDGEGIVVSRGDTYNQTMFLANKPNGGVSSHLTLENLTIDGTNITQFAIESANGSGSVVNLNNVKFANFSGLNYVVRARAAVNLNGVSEENCVCNQGVIEANEGKVTLSGANTVTIYLNKGRTLDANDLTGGVATVNLPADFGGEGTVVVNGCTDLNYFALGTGADDMKLAVSDGNIILTGTNGVESVEAEAEVGVAEYYNLQGVKVDNPSEGLYIRKVGNKVSKVIVK